MAKPAYKPGKKGGFPFGLKARGKGKAPPRPQGAMAPPFAKKK
jgi:hypothetical protein